MTYMGIPINQQDNYRNMEENISLVIDTTQPQQSLSSIKKELKSIYDEMSGLEKGSDAFINAAQKAGNLKRKVRDIQEAVKGASGGFDDMLQHVTSVSNGIMGAFTVARGAMTLFGVESEAVMESIKRLQALMAMGQGLNQVRTLIKTLPKLQAAIKGTSVAARVLRDIMTPKTFLLVTGAITGLILIFNKLKSSISDTNSDLTDFSIITNELNEAYKSSASTYAKGIAELEILKTVANDANQTLDNRLKALEKLNNIMPGYNAKLDETTKSIIANTDAEKDYIQQLEKEIKLIASKNLLIQKYEKYIEVQARIAENEEKLAQTSPTVEARGNSANLTTWTNPEYGDLKKSIDADREVFNSLENQIKLLMQTISSVWKADEGGGKGSGGSTSDYMKQTVSSLDEIYRKIDEYGQGTIASLINSAQDYFTKLKNTSDSYNISELLKTVIDNKGLESNISNIRNNNKDNQGIQTDEGLYDWLKNNRKRENVAISEYLKAKIELKKILDDYEDIVTQHKTGSVGFTELRAFLSEFADKEQLQKFTEHKYNLLGAENAPFTHWFSAEEWLNAEANIVKNLESVEKGSEAYEKLGKAAKNYVDILASGSEDETAISIARQAAIEESELGLIRFKKAKEAYFKLLNELGTSGNAITENEKIILAAAEKAFRDEHQVFIDTIKQAVNSTTELSKIDYYEKRLEGYYDKRLDLESQLEIVEAELSVYEKAKLKDTAKGLELQAKKLEINNSLAVLEKESAVLRFKYETAINDTLLNSEEERIKLYDLEISREEKRLSQIKYGTDEYYQQYLVVKKLQDEKADYEKSTSNSNRLSNVLNDAYRSGYNENDYETKLAYKQAELNIALEELELLDMGTAAYNAQLLQVNRLSQALDELVDKQGEYNQKVNSAHIDTTIRVSTNALEQMGATLSNISSIYQNIIKQKLEDGEITEENARKEFESAKKVAIAGAVMNTASAIINAWASWMHPNNAYMSSPIQVSLAVLQTAALATALGLQIQQIKQTELGSTGSVSSSTTNSIVIPPTDYSKAVDNAELNKKIGDTKYYVSVEEFNKVDKRYSTEVEESRF